jgi:Flp pilus assembly protein TadD
MQGRYPEALRELQRAAEQIVDDPTVLEHLGDTYLKLGDRPAAVEQWRKALEMNPESPTLLKRLSPEEATTPVASPEPADGPADSPRTP